MDKISNLYQFLLPQSAGFGGSWGWSKSGAVSPQLRYISNDVCVVAVRELLSGVLSLMLSIATAGALSARSQPATSLNLYGRS